MKTIQLVIDPAGEIRVETQGFSGASCREASKRLEQALGIVQSDTPTAEMYQNVNNQTEARQQTGS